MNYNYSIVSDYLTYCEQLRNLSPATLSNYSHMLRFWQEFLQVERIDIRRARQEDVLLFIRQKRKERCAASSINQYVIAVSSFYKWALRFHYGEFVMNPCESVQKLKAPKLMPLCVPEHRMKSIIEQLPEDTFQQLRSKAVILVAYHCGLRRAELCALRDVDVDFSTSLIRVYGKGRKERFVPMSPQAAACLRRYIDVRNMCGVSANRLFTTIHAQDMTYDEIAHLVKHVLGRFLPPAYCHCHILRHSFATACLNAGVTLENIAALMGHESIQTTLRYLTISADRIKRQLSGVF